VWRVAHPHALVPVVCALRGGPSDSDPAATVRARMIPGASQVVLPVGSWTAGAGVARHPRWRSGAGQSVAEVARSVRRPTAP